VSLDVEQPAHLAPEVGNRDPAWALRSLAALAVYAVFAVVALLRIEPFAIAAGFAALTYGVGAAGVALGPRRIDVGVAGCVGVGASVLIIGSLVMVSARFWHPTVFVVLLVVSSTAVHIRELARTRPGDLRAALRTDVTRAYRGVPAVVLGLSLVAFFYSLVAVRSERITGFLPIGGYLRVVPVTWYVAVGVLGLCIGYWARRRLPGGLLLSGLQLVVAVFAAPILAYGAPRSQSAEKHVAVVFKIVLQGNLDHIAPIYKSWPGFFSASAAGLQGFGDGDGGHPLAVYWPLLLAVSSFAVVSSLCRRLGCDHVAAFTVATIACLANVLQQDYFSPQSVGYLLALCLFAVCLSLTRKRCGAAHAIDTAVPSLAHPGYDVTGWQIGLAAFISFGIAVAHQFTPFAVAGAIGLLVVWGVLRPTRRGLLIGVAVVVPAVVWAIDHLGVVTSFLSGSQVGDTSNFTTPRTVSAPGVSRLPIVAISSLTLLAALLLIGVVAVCGGVRAIRNRTTLAMGTAALFAFSLIVVTPYGNEGIYRASLFAVPWLIILGLPAYRFLSRPGRLRNGVLAVLVVVLTGLYLVSSAGLDASNVQRVADAAVYRHVSSLAHRNPDTLYAVVQLGPGDLPTNRPVAPENVTYLRSEKAVPHLADVAVARRYIRNSIQAAYWLVGKPDVTRVYLIYSPASFAYAREYGYARLSDLRNLRQALRTDPRLQILSTDDGTITAYLTPGR
jgi:hypothetical protein